MPVSGAHRRSPGAAQLLPGAVAAPHAEGEQVTLIPTLADCGPRSRRRPARGRVRLGDGAERHRQRAGRAQHAARGAARPGGGAAAARPAGRARGAAAAALPAGVGGRCGRLQPAVMCRCVAAARLPGLMFFRRPPCACTACSALAFAGCMCMPRWPAVHWWAGRVPFGVPAGAQSSCAPALLLPCPEARPVPVPFKAFPRPVPARSQGRHTGLQPAHGLGALQASSASRRRSHACAAPRWAACWRASA
jgi:hypothetical protein